MQVENSKKNKDRKSRAVFGALLVFPLLMTGCSTYPSWLASSGPSLQQVVEQDAEKGAQPEIPVIAIDETVARKLQEAQKKDSFAQFMADKTPPRNVIGPGDVLEISVWEAPPAVLFGGVVIDAGTGLTSTRQTTFPEQVVNEEGMIHVPFAGAIKVAGETEQEIQRQIEQQLKHKANQPQVLVRVLRNATSNVTVVGEVKSSLRMPLTAQGERLLDAIAAAGGVSQPVEKTMIQLSRNGRLLAMPLEQIIRDPAQNVYLQPGDVITASYQPLSFTVLGAMGKNEEINFEAQGISLTQALARSGGLKDNQADARGLLIFRLEEAKLFPELASKMDVGQDGKLPVIYQLNLRDPRSFLSAQNFPVRNKDVIYVANAPAAELQKFLSIMTSSIYSITNTFNVGK